MDNEGITISDVAKKAGVSVSTVSKVFNNYQDISEKTKQKVLNAAEELNYSPAFSSRVLLKSENRRIGLFIEDYKIDSYFNPVIFDMLMGFKHYMNENDSEVILLTTTTTKQKRMLISNIVDSNRLNGVFFIGLKLNDPYLEEIEKSKFPCVLFDMPIKRERAGNIGVDNMKGAMIATEHLLQLGHRKVAFINGHKNAHVSNERLNGYFLALNKYDIPIDKNIIYDSDFTQNGGKKAMEILLRRDSSITAVFAACDLMAMGAVTYLDSVGRKVPDDISVVGFDDIEIVSHIKPSLTTIKQRRFELGVSAATLLVNLINGQNINNIYLEPELIIRSSTAKVRADK